jgi:hypothetical protein
MWPSLVKIQYTELKLSCGNDPVVRNSIYSNGDLDLWPQNKKERAIPAVKSLLFYHHVSYIKHSSVDRTLQEVNIWTKEIWGTTPVKKEMPWFLKPATCYTVRLGY